MSLYDEKPKAKKEEEIKDNPHSALSDIICNLVDFDDSVIYLNDDISQTTLVDFMIRIRSIIASRNEETKDDPINLIINSDGGDIHEMLGMLDYMESLSVKINTICRGRAFSAAAIILAYGTGTRMISKRSSVMFHQSSSFLSGKLTDMTAYVDNIKHIETTIYDLLGSKTKKDANWWREKMRTDFFLSPDQLVEYGVIDQII